MIITQKQLDVNCFPAKKYKTGGLFLGQSYILCKFYKMELFVAKPVETKSCLAAVLKINCTDFSKYGNIVIICSIIIQIQFV